MLSETATVASSKSSNTDYYVAYGTGTIRTHGRAGDVKAINKALKLFTKWLADNKLTLPSIDLIHVIRNEFDTGLLQEVLNEPDEFLVDPGSYAFDALYKVAKRIRAWMYEIDGKCFVFLNMNGENIAPATKDNTYCLLHEFIHCALKVEQNFRRIRKTYSARDIKWMAFLLSIKVSDYPPKRLAEETMAVCETDAIFRSQ